MKRIVNYTALLITFCFLSFQVKSQCHIDDWTALKALYESTDGDNWTYKTGWEIVQEESPPTNCNLANLEGVGLNAIGRVDCLDLDGYFNCEPSHSTGNNLKGDIPSDITLLRDLKLLGLARNDLTGNIPTELANLSNLTHLDLGGNYLTGNVPAELANLSNLTHLSLYRNYLTGHIPPELGDLSNLEDLSLSLNDLIGLIPSELGNLSNLKNLSLRDNNFTGNIPPELGYLSNLEYLDLNNNDLTGCYPTNLNTLCTQLIRAFISYGNDFEAPWSDFCATGTQTCLPNCNISDWKALKQLYENTNGNNWLNNQNWEQVIYDNPSSDCNLSDLYGITMDSLGRIKEINLNSNQLNGIIPSELGDLNSLKSLDLSYNQLQGIIPPEIGNLSSLTELLLHNNQLSGKIPSSLGALISLNHLIITNNNLSGCYHPNLLSLCTNAGINNSSISHANNFDAGWEEFCVTKNGKCNLCHYDDWLGLKQLYLNTNGFNWKNNAYWDEVTMSTPTLNCNLENLLGVGLNEEGRVDSLQLTGNQIIGNIPPELGDLSMLRYLSLEDNQLTGNIPSQLGSLNNLTKLSLKNNQLSGSIPIKLGSLNNLAYLSLENNQLNGIIPTELGSLNNLTYLSLENNQLNGTIPIELGSLNNLIYLSLNSNQLSGSIPAQFGSLNNLEYLLMYRNQLSGSIPTQLGDLSKLIFLHLSENELSGSIPPQSSSIILLGLNDNQLRGTIPKFNSDTLYAVALSNNHFTCDDVNVNFEHNQQIASFDYKRQRFTAINYDSIKTNVFDTLSNNRQLTLNVQLPWETTSDFSYQWKRNGETIVGATQANYIIDTVQSNTVGKYTLHLSNNCLPDGNTFEAVSDPIYVILKGYDLLGQSIEYTQLMVEFENQAAKERYEKEIFLDNGGIWVDKCDCNRELHLYDFPSDSSKIEQAYIALDQKIKSVSMPNSDIDGGFNYKLNNIGLNSLSVQSPSNNIQTQNTQTENKARQAYTVKYNYPNINYKDPVRVYQLDSGVDMTNIFKGHLLQPAPVENCYNLNAPAYNFTNAVSNINEATIPIDTNYQDRIGHGTFGFGAISEGLQTAPNAKIVPLKIIEAASNGNLFDLICAFYHAVDHNADVINISAGYRGESSGILETALYQAREKDIFVVAAAGNDALNIDNENDNEAPQYPAYYASQHHYFYKINPFGESVLDSVPYNNVISVAAVNKDNELNEDSNFGTKSVTIGAPGEDIYGQGIEGIDAVGSGTSIAAFLTSQVLAREIARDNNRNIEETWLDFENTYLKPNQNLDSKTSTGKQINFEWKEKEISGCMDCKACNYFPYATIDDGSCRFCTPLGCVDCPEDCKPCSVMHCNDGIQNEDETKIDCGGADCESCPDIECPNVCDQYPFLQQFVDCSASDNIIFQIFDYGHYVFALVETNAMITGYMDFHNEVYCNGSSCSTYIKPTGPDVVFPCENIETQRTCNDGIQNGQETDIDCGGNFCNPCSNVNPDIFVSYPFLNNYVDYNNCNGTNIKIFDYGTYVLALVETNSSIKGYSDYYDGEYCNENVCFDHYSEYYNLSNLTAEWNCNQTVNKDLINDIKIVDKMDHSFLVYPNPTTDIVNVKLMQYVDSPNIVCLFDISGKKLIQSTFSGNSTTLHLDNLPNGMYIIDLQNAQNKSTQKLLVK